MILTARVGKHTDGLIAEIVVSTEGKTRCQHWNTDGWGGYERVLPGKAEGIEKTNEILRQQTGRFQRRQNN